MLQAFVITLREGLEAFLIVAISLAYLRKSGRGDLAKAVHWGIVAAVVVSAGGGYLLYNAANQEWLDGPLAIVAAVSVAVADRPHVARRPADEGRDRGAPAVERAARPAPARSLGVFLFTLLMISREGMETALLLLQLRQTLNLVAGAAGGRGGGGVRGVAVVALRPPREPRAVLPGDGDLPVRVRRAALHLRASTRCPSRATCPTAQFIHAATESWGPDSVFGHVLTYLLVILPLGWLLLAQAARSAIGRAARVRRRPRSGKNPGVSKPPTVADLTWIGDLKFSGVSGVTSMTIDGDSTAGPSPVQALAFALAGCMADRRRLHPHERTPSRSRPSRAPDRRPRPGGSASIPEGRSRGSTSRAPFPAKPSSARSRCRTTSTARSGIRLNHDIDFQVTCDVRPESVRQARLHRLGARPRRAPDDRGAHGRRVDAPVGAPVGGLSRRDRPRRIRGAAVSVARRPGRRAGGRRGAVRRGGSRRDAAEAVCRRGLEIFILAFLFRLQAFIVSPGSHPVTLFRVDILNIMGPAIVAAGLVWALARIAG